jgi:hypothetical protein
MAHLSPMDRPWATSYTARFQPAVTRKFLADAGTEGYGSLRPLPFTSLQIPVSCLTHSSTWLRHRPRSNSRVCLYLVEAVCGKPEGRDFDYRLSTFIFLTTQFFQPHCDPGVCSASVRNENHESSWGRKARLARKANNLIANWESIVLTIWDPVASTACYGDKFTHRKHTGSTACYGGIALVLYVAYIHTTHLWASMLCYWNSFTFFIRNGD